MNQRNRFDELIETYPRQSLQMALIIVCLLWQSVVCVAGLILYILVAKTCRIQWWLILGMGLVIAAITIVADYYPALSAFHLKGYVIQGFLVNKGFWKLLLSGHTTLAWNFLFQHGTAYLFGLPLFLSGLLAVADLIKDNPHQAAIKALQEGKIISDRKEVSERKINKAMKKVDDQSGGGTVLGVSKYTGNRVVIPDHFINQIALVLGTTGSGKTVTLQRFYQRAMMKGYSLIIVDGKPTDKNVAWLQAMAEKHDRKFYGFNCGNYCHYDPLANGGYTELKDKIISLKDQWENDYYRSIAEDYLQATFEILLQSGKSFDLKQVTECLNHDDLLCVAREIGNDTLLKRVAGLVGYDHKDITGLKAHLNLLIHSELGQYFLIDQNMFSLSQAIEENAVVYFALPALRYPSFSKVLGKLVINDLKATIDRNNNQNKRVFMVFDEFSVFAGDQVLNLVNMGRGKGVHAIFGTQGLADLEKVDESFKGQLLNCANTLICHQLNDQKSAEEIAHWIGTKDVISVTAQLNLKDRSDGMGNVRPSKVFIVHPDAIKQELKTGEAFYVSKVGGFREDKVRVKYNV